MTTILPRPLDLPEFPWDQLAPAKARATEHPGGMCDLSVGTPVDDTPAFIREALAEASNAHGYPTVIGTAEVRDAILAWGQRRGMVDVGHGGVIPTIGSKEAVAWIPALLGVHPGDTVLVPEVAYPTYDIGARLAGATPVAVDPTNPDAWPEAALVYLNSPGNPDGHVMSKDELRAVVAWARAHGAVVVSDECYAALPWSEPYVSEGVPSLLDTDVCDGDGGGAGQAGSDVVGRIGDFGDQDGVAGSHAEQEGDPCDGFLRADRGDHAGGAYVDHASAGAPRQDCVAHLGGADHRGVAVRVGGVGEGLANEGGGVVDGGTDAQIADSPGMFSRARFGGRELIPGEFGQVKRAGQDRCHTPTLSTVRGFRPSIPHSEAAAR